MTVSPRILNQSLLLPLVFLILIRLYFQSSFPVFGDEAYYFYWGRHFAGGYYDLPPMIGWWERFFTFFSSHPFWLRIPNLFSILIVAFGMREWLAVHTSRAKSLTVSLLYALSPLPFLAVLISHDVLLLLFNFLSALLFYRAYQVQKPWKEYLFSGVLWGAAFLSKYFAVFTLPFYLIWHFTRKKGNRPISGIFWFALGSLPFLFQHLHWNANHCWSNFVFNLISRQQVDEGPVWITFGLFVLYLALIITPVFWFDVFKKPVKKWFSSRSSLESFLLGMWLVPISLFGITALMGRGQGLHWYFPYLPFFMMWIGLRHPIEALQHKLRQMMYWTYALAMIVLLVLFFPDSFIKKWALQRFGLDYQIAMKGPQFAEKVAVELNTASWGETDLVVADGYSHASVLDQELHRFFDQNHFTEKSIVPPVGVWGGGSRFGRVFDWTVDFLDYEGKNLTLISRSPVADHHWNPYFEDYRTLEKEIDGTRFWIAMGKGFRAGHYVKTELAPAWARFYPSFFLEKYFPSRCELRDGNE
jgi:hypothetical protein